MSMEVLQFVKDPVPVLVRSNTNIFIVVLVQLEWWVHTTSPVTIP